MRLDLSPGGEGGLEPGCARSAQAVRRACVTRPGVTPKRRFMRRVRWAWSAKPAAAAASANGVAGRNQSLGVGHAQMGSVTHGRHADRAADRAHDAGSARAHLAGDAIQRKLDPIRITDHCKRALRHPVIGRLRRESMGAASLHQKRERKRRCFLRSLLLAPFGEEREEPSHGGRDRGISECAAPRRGLASDVPLVQERGHGRCRHEKVHVGPKGAREAAVMHLAWVGHTDRARQCFYDPAAVRKDVRAREDESERTRRGRAGRTARRQTWLGRTRSERPEAQRSDSRALWQRCPREPELVLSTTELGYLRDCAGKRVCVLGNGDNQVVFALAGLGARVLSVDISQNQLDIARARARRLGFSSTSSAPTSQTFRRSRRRASRSFARAAMSPSGSPIS